MTERSAPNPKSSGTGVGSGGKSPDRKPVKSRKSTYRPRCVVLGDTTGSSKPQTIRKNTVTQRVSSARKAGQMAAVRDILSHPENSKAEKAQSLRAILEGAAADDAKAIRQRLRGEAKATRC